MHRKDRAISENEALDILKQGTYGVLSTVSPEGQPYGIPINYIYRTQDHSLIFHCAKVGQKLDYLSQNPKVSFVVVGKHDILPQKFTTQYESVIVTGIAKQINDESEKARALTTLCDRLAPGDPSLRDRAIVKHLAATTLYQIQIDAYTGKRNPGL